tara:strand:+ start:2937 stop:3080 length:144 start_codon:yes stop_codon:yes gene_type:complete
MMRTGYAKIVVLKIQITLRFAGIASKVLNKKDYGIFISKILFAIRVS